MKPITSLTVSSESKSSAPPVPEGVHIGALVGLYDIGTTYAEKFDKRSRKLILSFEFPELEPIEVERDGKKVKLPRVLTKRFTKSLHEKSVLLSFINSWRGKKLTADEVKNFELARMLGHGGQFQVIHESKQDGGIKAKINTVLPLPKGSSVSFTSPKEIFSVDQLDAPEEVESLPYPKWIIESIKESEEYQRLAARVTPQPAVRQAVAAGVAPAPGDEDDCPF